MGRGERTARYAVFLISIDAVEFGLFPGSWDDDRSSDYGRIGGVHCEVSCIADSGSRGGS